MPSYEETIQEVEDEIRTTPYNKATQHHIGLLKAKIAKLRIKKASRVGTKGLGYAVRKTGDSTVVLVGFPSVGKSTILNKITNADSKIAGYAFTTLRVIPGVMNYRHAKLQVLDIPGLIKGAASGSGMGKEVLSVVRSADLIVFVTEPYSLHQVNVLNKELYKVGIRVDERSPYIRIKKKEKGGVDLATTVKLTKIDPQTIKDILKEFSLDNVAVVIREDISADQLIDAIQGNCVYVPSLTIINKADIADRRQLRIVRKLLPDAFIMSAETDSPEALKRVIFEKLNIMRVYLKEVGKKADTEIPLVVKQGSTVGDICRKLHGDFLKKFKSAKVWGASAKFPGQVFHESHVLKDKDIVQINLI